MRRDIVLAVGGTGGHIIPAIELRKRLGGDYAVGIAGVDLNKQRLDGDIYSVSGSHLSRRHFLRSALKIGRGLAQSLVYLRKCRPKLVVGFGSYHSFPIVVAARLMRIPYVLYEPNLNPGRVNRLLASKALFTASFFDHDVGTLGGESRRIAPLKTAQRWDPDVAREKLGLEAGVATLLVTGGSQGARPLNQVMMQYIERYGLDMQVIHLCGKSCNVQDLQRHYQQKGIRAYVRQYESRMDMVWSSADMTLCRAGASTVSELLQYHVPAILIPYPYDRDLHQDANARFVVDTVKGGLIVKNEDLNAESLHAAMQQLRKNLTHFGESIENYHLYQDAKPLHLLLREVLM